MAYKKVADRQEQARLDGREFLYTVTDFISGSNAVGGTNPKQFIFVVPTATRVVLTQEDFIPSKLGSGTAALLEGVIYSGSYSQSYSASYTGTQVNFGQSWSFVNGTASLSWSLYGSGSLATAYNTNRYEGRASVVEFRENTISTGGTTIWTNYVPTSSAPIVYNTCRDEITLKPNTKYGLTFTDPLNGQDTWNIRLKWLEL